MVRIVSLLILLVCLTSARPSERSFRLGLLKYNGGGDWYANLETSLRNLVFANEQLGTNIDPEQGS